MQLGIVGMFELAAAKKLFGTLSGDAAMRLVVAACDIALVVDRDGTIRDVAAANADLMALLGAGAKWIGKKWSDLVVADGRPKVAALLREAAAAGPPKWRHLNYPARKRGPDIPIHHAGAALAADGLAIVFGRDLRAMAGLQQRLTDAQFAFENEMERVRTAERRYRALFQSLPEPVLILEGRPARVADANPAAQTVYDISALRAGPKPVAEFMAPNARKALEAAISAARSTGREETLEAAPAGRKTPLHLAVLAAGQAPDATVFLRAARAGHETAGGGADDLADAAPDGLVAVGPDGRIRRANRAFAELAQLAAPEQAVGEPIDRWLGRDGIDLDVLVANLRQRGAVRHYPSQIRGERGLSRDVEVNAAARGTGAGAVHLFALRAIEGRIATAQNDRGREGGRTPEQLAELIGRVPLKELVRESTDAIERMCIEAALELTGDNRASAAEMLGLSRQSLYVKLHRYGLATGDEGDDG